VDGAHHVGDAVRASTGAPEQLVADLVRWVAVEPRPYREALEAWRTSCPRLTVWEDAIDRGLIERSPSPSGPVLRVTQAGERLLAGEV
jgi:hypothetical protein